MREEKEERERARKRDAKLTDVPLTAFHSQVKRKSFEAAKSTKHSIPLAMLLILPRQRRERRRQVRARASRGEENEVRFTF